VPDHYHAPSSLEEIQAILREANEKKESVKVVGAGHSWSEIAMIDATSSSNNKKTTHMLSLDNYAKYTLDGSLFSSLLVL